MKSAVKKWTIRILSFVLLLSIISLLLIQYEINHHLGKNTNIVNPSQFETFTGPIAIENTQVLTADCTQMQDSMTVLIQDRKIRKLGKNIAIPTNYKRINGKGQFLIPGLVDTHVHLKASKNDLLLFIANGVTHISEMFGQKTHLNWKTEAKEGALSPQIYVATRKVGSQEGTMRKVREWFGSQHNYVDASTAKDAVRKYKELGYDAIKLSTFINEEIYKALTKEAAKLEIPIIGHLTSEVGLEGLYKYSQSQLAHVEEITKNTMYEFGGLGYSNTEEYLEYLKKNAQKIAKKLKERDIVVSSTVWIIESISKQNFEIDTFLKSIALPYQNPGPIEGSFFAKGWLPGNNSYEDMSIKNDPEMMAKTKLFWKTYTEAIYIMTKALVDAGVQIVTGTDTNGAGVIAGFSLHDEFVSLRRCGLTNSQILFAATAAPAKWMGSNAGSIVEGKRADLLLLNKNPLNDIRNTNSINSVIVNGRLIERKSLDAMLEAVKRVNSEDRSISINHFTQK